MKIAVLLSGGVDSSAALFRLKSTLPGASVTAYYLKIWLEDELSSFGTCPWAEDLSYAREVCALAGVPLKILNLQHEYRERIADYTISELKAGRTPSPDIFCNRRIKFGAFLDKIGESLDKVATGHYAVVEQGADGFIRIHRSPDPIKDQTYFLSHLTQTQASLAMFPIGDICKSDVRKLAVEWNLPNKDRKDSQGMCFLGRIKYPDFVRHYLGEREGRIIDSESGRILGTHKGCWFYTIGQRTGLGLSGGPWYVVSRDSQENTVVVAQTPAAANAARNQFMAANPNWIADTPMLPARVSVKLRHGPKLIRARIERSNSSNRQDTRLWVTMDESDRGIAAGQFAVFYNGDVCLGGAVIESSLN